jgi:hypothetical protein
MKYAIVMIAALSVGGCGSVVSGDEDGDTSTDTDPGDTTGDPDPGDTSGGDADVPDADPDPAEDTGPGDPGPDTGGCGDGTVDAGEECDDDSDFCVDCELLPPAGWVECTDSSGDPAFLFVEDWAGTHTQDEYADHCETMIEDMSPGAHAYHGLAVLADPDTWDCILSELEGGVQYFVGLWQDTADPGYAEPDGGWTWMADDGSGRTDVTPFDGSGPVAGSFDDGGGGGNVECGRLQGGMGGWTFLDYSCDAAMDWLGICMIQF